VFWIQKDPIEPWRARFFVTDGGNKSVFSVPADAVRCAIAMQREARRRAAPGRLAIRIGLHRGDELLLSKTGDRALSASTFSRVHRISPMSVRVSR
jgi:hypothetical protein